MEPGLGDLGISQPTQMQKMLKLKDVLTEKKKNTLKKKKGFAQLFLHDFEKSKSQSIYSHKWLFEEINGVTHRSSQSSQKKPKIERELSRKVQWVSPLSNRVNPRDVHGRSRKFLRIVYHQKYYHLAPKGKKH